MQYTLVKGNNIEINLYVIQLFHRVQCNWLQDQTQAVLFIKGRHLRSYLHCILRLLSKGSYLEDHGY